MVAQGRQDKQTHNVIRPDPQIDVLPLISPDAYSFDCGYQVISLISACTLPSRATYLRPAQTDYPLNSPKQRRSSHLPQAAHIPAPHT